MESISRKLLDRVELPDDLRKIDLKDLPELCEELRSFIIDAVSKNPGHLGASLGVVELTAALHYAYNTPDDVLVWDVGHQAYAHKILTGRKHLFNTNRKYRGISGFPRRKESKYDAFGTGHSSTSISAALGMAIASASNPSNKRHHIAIIGDASISGGMALEALNHAGVSNTDILIILNDNCMAIDNNVGALNEYLTDITLSSTYNKVKGDVWKTLGGLSKFGRVIRSGFSKFGNAIKSTIIKESNFFQSLNLRYFGPVDGHDVIRLVKIFEDLQKIPGPKLLHCITVKGKGYSFAEQQQTLWHAPGLFNKSTGEIVDKLPQNKPTLKYQDVFGKTLIELADRYPDICAVTPAMISGSGLTEFAEKFPDRIIDVGIAEQHALTFSTGLALSGKKAYCCIYSSFLQRAYDQLIHDAALQKIPLILCIDRAGLVGEDGATHHGVFDMAYMRLIPNIVVSAPMDENELRNFMFTAAEYNKSTFSIRYPKGSIASVNWQNEFQKLEIGKARMLKDGKDAAILSIGHAGNNVAKAYGLFAKEGIDVAHYDMRFVKPIDEKLLHEVAKKFDLIITVEDGAITGGFGSAVLEFLSDFNYKCRVVRMGVPDNFVEHGKIEELQTECGFHPEGIALTLKAELLKNSALSLAK